MRQWIGRPSPAMIVALLALFVALGAGAYAANKLKRNQVKSKHIAPDAAKGVDVDEASLQKVPASATADNAAALGGTAVGGYPKVFTGTSTVDNAGPQDEVMFSVPQIGVSVLEDDFVSSEGGMAVRNDRAAGTIVVADNDDVSNGTTVGPGTIYPNGVGAGIGIPRMPVTITSASVPGAVLTVFCGTGAPEVVCTGFLVGA